uniref:Uncharacterized protein n=1 Tax=viral metagenome TaxID=1070528 RepID=A0A6C0K190_9ZZZZ
MYRNRNNNKTKTALAGAKTKTTVNDEDLAEARMQEAREWLARHPDLHAITTATTAVTAGTASLYYRKFIDVMLQEPVLVASTSCFRVYDHLRAKEELLADCVPYHVMPLIGHIPHHLWMGLVPINIHLAWLRDTDFSDASIASFLRAHELRPMECILQDPTLSPDKKEVAVKKMWEWLASQPRMPRACRFLGIQDFLRIQERKNKIHWMGFMEVLHKYEYPDRKHVMLLDLLGKNVLPQAPSNATRKQRITTTTTRDPRFLNMDRHLPLLSSVFRPWISWDFHTMLLQPVGQGKGRVSPCLGKQCMKGWFQPTMRFHQAYLEGGGGTQTGDVYECAVTKERFRILYGASSSSWHLQNERIMAREKQWSSRSRLVLPVARLQKHLCMHHLSDPVSLLARSVHQGISVHVSLSVVEEMVVEASCSSADHRVADVLSRLYHVYGRLCPKEPLAPYHTSLITKMQTLLHCDARLLTTPMGFLFPEFFSYSEEERAMLDEVWTKASERFVSRMLVTLMGRDSGFSIMTTPTPSTPHRLPKPLSSPLATQIVYSQASEEHLTIKPEILDLLEEEELAHLDVDAIRTGCRLSITTTSSTQATTTTPITHVMESQRLQIEDIEAFILDLEMGKKMEVIDTDMDIGIENDGAQEQEEAEIRDEEVEDEDGFDEVEVDVEEFYGGGEEEDEA